MASRRIIIVMHNDLMDYPPMISLIDIMKELGEDIVYIGHYTESPTTQRFEQMGIKLIKLGCIRKESDFYNLRLYRNYKKNLFTQLENLHLSSSDLVWYIYSYTANAVHEIVAHYRYVIHYFEYTSQKYSWKYRLLYPSYNQTEFAKGAIGIVHCEYNRAQIFRAINGLDKSPFVIPNKPYVKDEALNEKRMPDEIKSLITIVKHKVVGKRVILYQGYFESKERRLEEFCQAINMMPSEYVMIAMGKGPDDSYYQLKKKYESERIIFIPFIIPPYHLLVTQLASIGVMTYSPPMLTYDGVVNSLYCAPNKIFEYSRYGKPMIANNVPGLKYIFDEYHCGEVIEYPITPSLIIEALYKLFSNYDSYAEGAARYYNSIDLVEVVKKILYQIEMRK